ncbi:20423_t:CDS:2 [Rhizophagus irregularis]|nr:20423_t:CDS:2 [Rhizophagus irregularis]
MYVQGIQDDNEFNNVGTQDLKALHNAGYVHKYYKNPSSILVFDDKFCAIETFLECKALTLLNTNEKDLRPNIHEVYYSLLNLWSSIYHNKYPTPLNLICLEFIAADKDYSKSNFQEMITQKAKNSNLESLEMITKEAENSNLEPLEMIKYIKKNDLVNIRNINELKIIPPIDNDQFCKISKAILKIKKTDIIVACKRFKSTQLDRTFFYELKMHKKLYSCLRILCVLGISLVKLGRMRGIQDFQDIKCDDDEVQGIQDNNVNDTDAQVTSTETSNNGTIDDINHDLDILINDVSLDIMFIYILQIYENKIFTMESEV